MNAHTAFNRGRALLAVCTPLEVFLTGHPDRLTFIGDSDFKVDVTKLVLCMFTGPKSCAVVAAVSGLPLR